MVVVVSRQGVIHRVTPTLSRRVAVNLAPAPDGSSQVRGFLQDSVVKLLVGGGYPPPGSPCFLVGLSGPGLLFGSDPRRS